MPFAKGQSGNPGGRPKGRQNNTTVEIRALAQSLFDKEYWDRIKAQLKAGTLHPSIEARLLTYAYGEPRQEQPGEKVVVNVGFLSAMPHKAALEPPDTSKDTVEVMTLPASRSLR